MRIQSTAHKNRKVCKPGFGCVVAVVVRGHWVELELGLVHLKRLAFVDLSILDVIELRLLGQFFRPFRALKWARRSLSPPGFGCAVAVVVRAYCLSPSRSRFTIYSTGTEDGGGLRGPCFMMNPLISCLCSILTFVVFPGRTSITLSSFGWKPC